jgi:hypothetical protein
VVGMMQGVIGRGRYFSGLFKRFSEFFILQQWLEIAFSEVVNGVTNGLDFLCLFVWDGDTDLLSQAPLNNNVYFRS